METSKDFANSYSPNKKKLVSSVRILNDIEAPYGYYRIDLNGHIPIKLECVDWSIRDYLHRINNIGMMYSEVTIQNGKSLDFDSLDEFVYYSSLSTNESLPVDFLQKYPFHKEKLLPTRFEEEFNLYFNEIFTVGQTLLTCIDYKNYKEGYYYYNSDSVRVLGCTVGELFWCFSDLPYI